MAAVRVEEKQFIHDQMTAMRQEKDQEEAAVRVVASQLFKAYSNSTELI